MLLHRNTTTIIHGLKLHYIQFTTLEISRPLELNIITITSLEIYFDAVLQYHKSSHSLRIQTVSHEPQYISGFAKLAFNPYLR